MRIVFDSSVMYDDLRFALPYSRLLLQAARAGEIHVVIPEVVVLESEKRFREKVEKRVRVAETSQRELRELGVEYGVDLPDVQEATSRYTTGLRLLLRQSNVEVPTPPNVAHLDVARRAIARTQPFSGSGAGYQDTLIWLQVVEEARTDDVVFLTRDAHFTDGSGNLARDLVADLEAAQIPVGRVKLAAQTADAVQSHVGPSIKAVTRVRAAIGDPGFGARLLEAVADQLLYSEIPVPDDDEELRRLDVHDAEVDALESLEDIEVDDAQELEGGTIAFNFGGVVTADVSIYPMRYEAAGARLDDVVVLDWNWNERVVHAAKSIELNVEGQAELDPANNELVGAHVFLLY